MFFILKSQKVPGLSHFEFFIHHSIVRGAVEKFCVVVASFIIGYDEKSLPINAD